jgi:hypothetical protein
VRDVEYGPVLIVCGKFFHFALFSYFHTHLELYITGGQDHAHALKRYLARRQAKECAELLAHLKEVGFPELFLTG